MEVLKDREAVYDGHRRSSIEAQNATSLLKAGEAAEGGRAQSSWRHPPTDALPDAAARDKRVSTGDLAQGTAGGTRGRNGSILGTLGFGEHVDGEDAPLRFPLAMQKARRD